jgi:hypothetical protein
MRTPFGVECPYFYGDYYRGKHLEECRLIGNRTAPNNWKPELCKTCPVPGIKRANACSTLTLSASIKKGAIKVKRQVKVTAFCTRSQMVVDTPEIGCGICHPIDGLFTEPPK